MVTIRYRQCEGYGCTRDAYSETGPHPVSAIDSILNQLKEFRAFDFEIHHHEPRQHRAGVHI